ncbi:MAG: ParB N-terminal domain-containing protein [Nitrososphaerota archaeon]|jgi:hypothetical protein|nr:ParB N-terminal domain-containing protein [Nitrososphaerota archaeon]
MTVNDFFDSVKADFSGWLKGQGEINADVFIDPAKYTVILPIEKLVADSKVTKQGIDIYKQKLRENQKINPIIVVKHPRRDVYAVLDGHHRYYAYLELGRREVKCALAGDYSSVIFYLTEHGYFQPSPEFTKGLRQPAVNLHHNLKQFLTNFLDSLT